MYNITKAWKGNFLCNYVVIKHSFIVITKLVLSAMYTERTTLPVCSFCPPPMWAQQTWSGFSQQCYSRQSGLSPTAVPGMSTGRKNRYLPHNQISLRNLFWLRWWHSSYKYYCPEGRCSHRMVMPGPVLIFPIQHWALWCECPRDMRCWTLVLHMRWLNWCSPSCLQEQLQDKTKDRSQKCTKSSFLLMHCGSIRA